MVYGKINGFEERKDSFVTSPNDVYFVYMDGAYLSNDCVPLGCSLSSYIKLF